MEDALKIEPKHAEDRIIFVSMYNDIDWTERDNEKKCKENPAYVAAYARSLTKGHW